MNKKLIAVSILSALLLSAPAMAQEEDEGWSIGGTITGTTDYVFRGVSQTAEDPALQGSIDIGHSSGFYAGVWGSNVDFEVPGDGINTEIDVYVGWVFSLPSEVELDLQAVRYIYPGSNSGFNIDYNEYIAALSVSYFTGTIAYSDDFVKSWGRFAVLRAGRRVSDWRNRLQHHRHRWLQRCRRSHRRQLHVLPGRRELQLEQHPARRFLLRHQQLWRGTSGLPWTRDLGRQPCGVHRQLRVLISV
jgi:hypothetical protein